MSLGGSSRCVPYGIPPGCRAQDAKRWRTVPGWLRAGRPVAITCAASDDGSECLGAPKPARATVGESCDKEMIPVAGVR